jgi:hypothetical protein
MFVPGESGAYEGEVRIDDEASKQCFMRMTGRAENFNVYLAEPSVEPDPAYISLSSRNTIKIYNRSECPTKFSWTAFTTLQEEGEKERAGRDEELVRIEELEHENLANMEFSDAGSDDSLSDDEAGRRTGEDLLLSCTRTFCWSLCLSTTGDNVN